MNLSGLGLSPAVLAGAVPVRQFSVGASQLISACRIGWEQGARLVGLWASDERDRERGFQLRVALQDDDGLTLLMHGLPEGGSQYPDLGAIFPGANRMQRAAFDLVGIASESEDQRSWLRHAAWPADVFPLRRDVDGAQAWPLEQEDYPFVRVQGDGVHEIPVGPVHAGIIEPGHFRFQIVGEKVLRLEERLGYVHKGIEKRFESMTLQDGFRLAGRISGDSTVAFAWAYAQAVEAMAEVPPPARAVWLRALLLERERIANHLGDLGYLGNDGGFAFGLAQFSRLREDVLRLNAEAFGHRLLMDTIVPGGVACDLVADHVPMLRRQCAELEREVALLRNIYEEHAGLQDRFRTCGQVSTALAQKLGITGLAARGSGLPFDLRCDLPVAPYDGLEVRKSVRTEGDVAARVALRFDEIMEALRLIQVIVDAIPDGETNLAIGPVTPYRHGIGYVEGWRGPALIALESGPAGSIRRCHPQDPSWLNWPVLEHAIIGNIVPDFPLINKSFNLSYSGHDV
jgi:Ni,Fe-hydrogenase III large subunit/Ni,Fe-hydrogenase III component G